MPEPLMTPDEVQAWLRINRRVLSRLVVSGILPALHVGYALRFDPTEVLAALNVRPDGAGAGRRRERDPVGAPPPRHPPGPVTDKLARAVCTSARPSLQPLVVGLTTLGGTSGGTGAEAARSLEREAVRQAFMSLLRERMRRLLQTPTKPGSAEA